MFSICRMLLGWCTLSQKCSSQESMRFLSFPELSVNPTTPSYRSSPLTNLAVVWGSLWPSSVLRVESMLYPSAGRISLSFFVYTPAPSSQTLNLSDIVHQLGRNRRCLLPARLPPSYPCHCGCTPDPRCCSLVWAGLLSFSSPPLHLICVLVTSLVPRCLLALPSPWPLFIRCHFQPSHPCPSLDTVQGTPISMRLPLLASHRQTHSFWA